jgi:hypothetical protein
MARYRIELATVVEVLADVDSMADAQKFALNFITKNAAAGAPRYKLHAIYNTEIDQILETTYAAGVSSNAAEKRQSKSSDDGVHTVVKGSAFAKSNQFTIRCQRALSMAFTVNMTWS